MHPREYNTTLLLIQTHVKNYIMARKFKPYVASEDLVRRFHSSYTGPPGTSPTDDNWGPADTASDLENLTGKEIVSGLFGVCLQSVTGSRQITERDGIFPSKENSQKRPQWN